MFNGSFKEKTIYREDPSPEVDEAWEALGVDCKKGLPGEFNHAYNSQIAPLPCPRARLPLPALG